MRISVITVLVCIALQGNANNYYFSSISGNDSYSSAQAQSPATPWRTIDKLNSFFYSLAPGDSVLFKSGEIYNGSIFIAKSGSAALPIVFSSYATGARPIISGFTELSNWTSMGGGVWEANVAAPFTRINSLVINGNVQPLGRYPNATAPNKGYLNLESSSGNSQITDIELLPSPNWTGGEVVIRKNRWITDRNFITNHSGNTISYNSESGYGAYANYGYFIQNHPSALDVNGEWYFKAQEKKIGVYSTTSPSGLTIQVSTIDKLVVSYNQSNVVFNNFTFKGANENAFELGNSHNFRISNCDILFSGVNAVNALGCNNVTLEHSLIDHSNNNGFSGGYCSSATIRNNRINNTGMFAGMGKGGDGNYEAIVIDGDNETIEFNEIDSTGYVPITFRGNENLIKNNFVSNFTMVKDDGGGIYTWNNTGGAANHGNKIIGNVVLNGVGAGEGTDDPFYLAANGIYIDDGTANAEIIGNTVANCALQALYIHNGYNLEIEGNTFFNSRRQMAVTRDNFAPNSPVRNLNMTNNILFSKESYQPIAEFWTDYNDIAQFGIFDHNFYCRPLDDNSVISVNYNANGGNTNKNLTLDEWKALYGKDHSTKKTPIRVPSTDFIRFEYNATGVSKSILLDDQYIDVRNNSYSGSVTLNPFSSIILLKTTGLGDTTAPPSTCPDLGSILREQWNNVTGITVNNIPLQNTPDNSSQVTLFESPTNIGDNYGARIRGYVCPPSTGNYNFTIASDDASELWLSTDDNPANKLKIAYVLTWTNSREWNKFPTQKSGQMRLEAGRKYYIEAIHKEAFGGDNLAVSWQLPNGIIEAPIPGNRLTPFVPSGAAKINQTINFAPISSKVFGDPPFNINATASSGLPVSFRVVSGPANLSGNTITLTGPGAVDVEATQPGNSTFNPAPSATQIFSVFPTVTSSPCSGTGSISYDRWNNLGGNTLNNLSFLQTIPSVNGTLALFEGSTDVSNDYASRIRGYVCPPQSGNYTFWISGDDNSELWLSTDDNPANKTKIAYVIDWTNPREWNKYSFQKSVQIYLQSGQKYYIEALHKEGGGGDNLAVQWQLPGGVMESPMPGSRLIPYTSTIVVKADQTISFSPIAGQTFGGTPFNLSATASSGLAVSYHIVSGPATLSGNTLTTTGVGAVNVEASQAGNAAYNAAPPVTQSFNVTSNVSAGCSNTGSISYERWNNLGGNTLNNLSFLQTTPSVNGTLALFEGSTDVSNDYASRIRGYVCPPQSGNYTFWISGDDNSELWLSTDDNPANKTKIAYVIDWTNPREWNKYSFQKSVQIYLQSGQKYYIEALHKEGGGGDNLAVQWQLPGGVMESPMPGSRLIPYTSTIVVKADQTISFSPIAGQTFGGTPFNLSATASSGLAVSYHIVSGPATLSGNTLTTTGVGAVNVEASQAGNAAYNAAPPVTQSFNVTSNVSAGCSNTGSISYDRWNNLGGNTLNNLSFLQTTPSVNGTLALFEGSTDVSNDYASRIRGYVCPPQSGNYTFWISGDDNSELWLSTDDNLANKTKIAYVIDWTNPREWNKYSFQKSVQIYLQSGQKYYIEALHKEGGGGDNLAVQWQLPGGVMESPIPGSRLIPFPASSMSISRINSEVTASNMSVGSVTKAAAISRNITPIAVNEQHVKEEKEFKLRIIKVSPNPNKGLFTLQLSNLNAPKVTMQVIDQTGKVVEQKIIALTGKTALLSIPVDIKNRSAGVYTIKVITDEGIVLTKVIVTH